MRLKQVTNSRRREPDLTSLINVVFLILIFFIVAGTLRPFSARDITLAKSSQGSGVTEPAHLIARADGSLFWRGDSVSLEELVQRIRSEKNTAEPRPLMIVSDARLEAKTLLGVMRTLRAAGIGDISILTEKPRAN